MTIYHHKALIYKNNEVVTATYIKSSIKNVRILEAYSYFIIDDVLYKNIGVEFGLIKLEKVLGAVHL